MASDAKSMPTDVLVNTYHSVSKILRFDILTRKIYMQLVAKYNMMYCDKIS